MSTFDECVRHLSATVHQHYPEWTQSAEEDPGITLLELFAFLAENLTWRSNQIPEQVRSDIARIIAKLGMISGGCKTHTFKRVNYIEGQLLTAEDLAAEQRYNREKRQLHNKELHGYGIVSGLETQVDGSGVQVSPGLAIDPLGNEVIVPCSVHRTFPRTTTTVYLSLLYSEQETDPVPATAETRYGRIAEGFTMLFELPPSNQCIPLAKFIQNKKRWRIDRRYKPPRVK